MPSTRSTRRKRAAAKKKFNIPTPPVNEPEPAQTKTPSKKTIRRKKAKRIKAEFRDFIEHRIRLSEATIFTVQVPKEGKFGNSVEKRCHGNCEIFVENNPEYTQVYCWILYNQSEISTRNETNRLLHREDEWKKQKRNAAHLIGFGSRRPRPKHTAFEAEFHSVLRHPNGSLLDITPDAYKQTSRRIVLDGRITHEQWRTNHPPPDNIYSEEWGKTLFKSGWEDLTQSFFDMFPWV